MYIQYSLMHLHQQSTLVTNFNLYSGYHQTLHYLELKKKNYTIVLV